MTVISFQFKICYLENILDETNEKIVDSFFIPNFNVIKHNFLEATF